MRFAPTIEVLLLLAGIATADFAHILVKPDTSPVQKRDEYCNKGSCVACFGPGQEICSDGATLQTCFNPSGGEQCCADGTYCVGKDTSCCGSVGAGVTLSDTPTTATATSKKSSASASASATVSAPQASSSSWTCFASDSNEQCCQRGGSANHWCYGNFPTRYCYRPALGEFCCSDGNVCEGTGCCADYGAVATTPNSFQATSVPKGSSSASTGLILNTSNAFASTTASSATTTRSVSIPGAGGATTTSRSTTTAGAANAAATHEVMGGAFAAAAGLFGLALL